MGASWSRAAQTVRRTKGLGATLAYTGVGENGSAKVLTLDALDTLYRFRKPIGHQYLDVAQKCGYNQTANPGDIQKAFREVYRDLVKDHPNYGTETLASPAAWWSMLIERTFQRATNGAPMPHDLVDKLYSHFASAAAYELFPDVKPLFQRLRETKRVAYQSMDLEIWKEMPIVGIITNSDDRVYQVLEDLGLSVGRIWHQRGEQFPRWHEVRKRRDQSLMDWRPGNDIDFVCTSYETASEKPDAPIFDYALRLAENIGLSQASHLTTVMQRTIGISKVYQYRLQYEDNRARFDWVHIGNDLHKDWQGAIKCGSSSPLYLPRGTPHKDVKHVMESDARKALVIENLDRVWNDDSAWKTFNNVPGEISEDYLKAE